MSDDLFKKFDDTFDTEALAESVKNTKSGDFEEVPVGTYEVEVEKLALVASKKGDPMLSCWFKVLAGDHANSRIFMNQVLVKSFGIHSANDFLRSLDSGVDVEFINYSQYGNMIMDVFEAISGSLEYQLNYGKNDKGYNTFEIEEVFEVE